MHRFAISKPITTLMFALAILFFGYTQRQKMPETYLPNVDIPVVTVMTTYKNGSAEVIESKITDKIEEAISSISELESVSSNTSRGVSVVVAQFKLTKSIEDATNDVRDKVASIELPSGVDKPVIEKYSMNAAPIITLFVSTTSEDVQNLMIFANETVKPKLQNVRGVGQVSVIGLRNKILKITPNIAKLSEYGLDLNDLANKINEENIKRDGGRVVQHEKEWSISIDADALNVEELKTIKIKDGVLLGDVATVLNDISDERTYANFNSNSGVLLEIKKVSGANEIEIADSVKEQIPTLQKLSKEFHIDILFDSTTFIKSTLHSVQFDLVLGCALASLVVLVFLRNLTLTFVAAIALPVSIFGVLAIMGWNSQTLNLLTLTALTLAIGIIIDDAIVVIENIYKKLEDGIPRLQAAKEGVGEISFSILAISAMLLAVFIPIANMSGLIGRFFTSFGITIVAAVCVSYIIVITLIPMVISLVAKPVHSAFYLKTERIFLALEQWYKTVLTKALHYQKTTLLSALVLFILSLVLSENLGMVFMPKEDKSQFKISLTASTGISMEAMKVQSLKIQKELLTRPEVDYSSLSVGLNSSIHEGAIFVKLVSIDQRRKSQQEIMNEIREQAKAYDGIEININETEDGSAGSEIVTPFQIILRASNEALVETSARKLMEHLHTIQGATSIQSNIQKRSPELSLKILSANSAKYGVKTSDIANLVALAYSGEMAISYYRQNGKEYDIVMRLSDEKRMSPEEIGNLFIKNDKDQMILLSSLVHITHANAPTTIKRWDRQKYILVGADLSHDLTLDQLVDSVIAHQDQWLLEGVSYELEGDAKSMAETNEAFGVAIMAAIIMIYLILASLYESPLQPIIIMSAMPLSFTGAFLGLYFANMPMSLFSMMGLFLLLGLVGKNSTLVVDAANKNRDEAMDLESAIVHAGVSRLRPILMTTIAMCFGMLPLAISIGEGSGIKAPMGISVIFGLLISTLLSLFVVPAFYKMVAPWDDKLRKFYTQK
ncbi:efflux RND transporter permease subunit [Sulfurospirillum sp. hDNRA2]|uniref:efflux RND transporter permease subunit n=1 Tax=Sulfurospirillum sp. hDNRA2 TaxID=3237298 RepID=UPI0020B757AC|nr:efflux RND transporter permease subunit [Sulfurospirillum sp. DNRA8]MCP3651728.1 efflux RND transporter permease subunit [Sulfurospirillum sp. DNRA8]MCR1810575.1 efflux RND transporter permease subunit [Sulfurospirillum sp. DNRA8]